MHDFFSSQNLRRLIVSLAVYVTQFTVTQVYVWSSLALPKIVSGTAGFTLTELEQSLSVSLPYAGAIVGCFLAGFLMDKIGRKNILLISSLLLCANWAIIFLTKNGNVLCAARAFLGVSTGINILVLPLYAAELIDPKSRGKLFCLVSSMLPLTGIYSSAVGQSTYAQFAFLSLIPTILALVLMLFIPESPYYYLMKGQNENAIESIRVWQGDCTDEKFSALVTAVENSKNNVCTLSQIFKSPLNRRPFYINASLGILKQSAGLTNLSAFASKFAPPSFFSPEQNSLVLFAIWFLGSVVTSFLIDRFRRRIYLFVNSIGAMVCFTIAGIILLLMGDTKYDLWPLKLVQFITIGLAGIFVIGGIFSISNMLMGELFAVEAKAKAGPIILILFSFISFILSHAFDPLTKYVGMYANVGICAISCLSVAVISLKYLVETKGLTLEEIQLQLSASTAKEGHIIVERYFKQSQI